MRVTISHDKTQQQVKDAVDHGIDQVFEGLGGGAVDLTDKHHEWHENTLMISMTARLVFIRTPLKGSVIVGEKDVTVDVDLGLLGKLVSDETVRRVIETRMRGMLT
jgi:Putative polyhydroxyalkanoic acid system protein (PHA_gran_rgn)